MTRGSDRSRLVRELLAGSAPESARKEGYEFMTTVEMTGATASADQTMVKRVLVIDDDLVAAGLRSSLEMRCVRVRAPAGRAPSEILDTVEDYAPDLAIIEPNWVSEDLIPELRRRVVDVVVLTSSADELMFARALEAGATGIIEKRDGLAGIVDDIFRVLRGEAVTGASTRDHLLHTLAEHRRVEHERLEPFTTLTPSEVHVMCSLLEGRTAEEISSRANRSVATVRSQINSILQKLGVHSQLAAVLAARRAGWPQSHSV